MEVLWLVSLRLTRPCMGPQLAMPLRILSKHYPDQDDVLPYGNCEQPASSEQHCQSDINDEYFVVDDIEYDSPEADSILDNLSRPSAARMSTHSLETDTYHSEQHGHPSILHFMESEDANIPDLDWTSKRPSFYLPVEDPQRPILL